ncbi:MAG: site-2 protease family protein [Erythrobacter sp.]|uniref:site-2 protease family protein n=1 Tax=Erythrobacter sp. TaxID=1042 RepID=UPI00261D6197|nr:site-2 protease family protein [Erythrobacter sp.]MDJ0978655.1 site-2 protease family protein [Erythrobacter sp.]
MSDTLLLILVLVPCLVIAIVFHEVAHGYAAKLLGDTTASERGRLTLNPIRHVDPVGTLLVPGALALAGGPVFGWAKPVPVMKSRLRNPRLGMMAVAAAGPGSNFVLAFLGALALGVAMIVMGPGVMAEDNIVGLGLTMFLLINIFLGLFNLLPIPPFDGSHIVGGLLPVHLRRHWERLQRVGIVLILGVIAYSWMFGTSWIASTLLPPVEWAMGLCLRFAGWIAGAP